jgi:hypothetical protein
MGPTEPSHCFNGNSRIHVRSSKATKFCNDQGRSHQSNIVRQSIFDGSAAFSRKGAAAVAWKSNLLSLTNIIIIVELPRLNKYFDPLVRSFMHIYCSISVNLDINLSLCTVLLKSIN